MALASPKTWLLPRERRLPDPGLKPRLDERGHPYYRLKQSEKVGDGESNPLGLEYLTVRGTWAPERRTLSRLISEGLIDHRDEKLVEMLEARGIHLPPHFSWDAKVHTNAFREVGSSVCARVLNVLGGNRQDGDRGIVSRSGWQPLGHVLEARRPHLSFIEAGEETPLRLDDSFMVAMGVDGIHRAVEGQLRGMGIIPNGVPYGLRVRPAVNF